MDKPVAWAMPRKDSQIMDVITPEEHAREEGSYTVPLYAAPQPRREVELTDEEIIRAAAETKSAEPGRDGYILPITFARAVIATYRAKQGETK